MLSLFAALLGVVFARASLRGLIALLPSDLPRADLVTVDWVVLSLAAAVATLVGVVFGVAPALQARRLNVQGVLKSEGDRSASASRSRQLTRSALVVAEVAISFVLVIGAGLLVRTVLALRAVDPGFESRNVLRMEFQLPPSRYPADYSVYPRWPRHQRLYAGLQAGLVRIPGVESSALAAAHPMAAGFTNSFVIVGREAEAATQPEIHVRAVTSGSVRTLGVRLLDGRDLEPSDGADQPAVALINEAAARRFFPSGDAIGRQIRFWGVTREIVGVVGNERFQGLTAETPPAVYLSLPQSPMATGSVLVRTAGDPMGVASAVRSAVRGVDPELAVFDVATLDQTVLRSISRERSTMMLLVTFAAVALLLALVGVHGVLACTVSHAVGRGAGVLVAGQAGGEHRSGERAARRLTNEGPMKSIGFMKRRTRRSGTVLAALSLAVSCGRPPIIADPVQREFWNSLRDLCGQSFEGRLVEATAGDSALAGQPLVLDMWQCYARELRIAFHVGNDHSRVWLLTPTATGLSLTHQLHSADGAVLPYTAYGGKTHESGTATVQRFLPDDGTLDRIPSAAGSVWTIEVVPRDRITYRLDSRAGVFLVEFDLAHIAHRPPSPWGYTRTRGAAATGSEGS